MITWAFILPTVSAFAVFWVRVIVVLIFFHTVQRFETTLAITNREYNASLENSSSAYYERLEKQIEQAV